MTKAIEAFTVRTDSGLKTFDVGDEVPDEVAAKVGAHVLDDKPKADLSKLEEMDFENADEALKAAIELAGQKVDELEEENERLQAEVKELTEFKEKILSGDLSDLDLDQLSKDGNDDPDGSGNPGDPDPDAFDPDAHNVPEVLAYLEGADPDEDARVRAAEKAGQNRKGIVGDDE